MLLQRGLDSDIQGRVADLWRSKCNCLYLLRLDGCMIG
jgi:hypothetical protein